MGDAWRQRGRGTVYEIYGERKKGRNYGEILQMQEMSTFGYVER